MDTPSYIVDCDPPETWNGETCHPRVSYYPSYDDAMGWIKSKLSLSAEVSLKHKHIFGIRKYGANSGDWMFRTAG